MADTLKTPDYHCPKCGAKCAEFKLRDEAFTRWSCVCGAGGRLTGGPAAPAAPRRIHPHWTQRKAA